MGDAELQLELGIILLWRLQISTMCADLKGIRLS